MKNFVFIATLMYIIGIIMGLYLKISIVFLLYFIFAILAFYLFKRMNKKLIVMMVLIILFSSLYTRYRCYLFEEKYKDIDDVKLIGRIVNVESKTEYYVTYEVKVKKLNNMDKFKGNNILVKVKINNKVDLNLGDIIQVDGKIRNPEVRRNYNGFDYKKYLNSKNIYTVVNANFVKIVNTNNRLNVFYIKEQIINRLESILKKDNSSICLALTIGYKINISDDVNEYFKESNLMHLLAISGIHVAYISMIINNILRKFTKRKTKILIIFFLCFYILITNSVPSVFRACIMQIMILISSLIYRKSNLLTNMSISALVLLIINPLMIYNIGFIFSYVGTISIVVFNKYIKKCFDFLEIKFFGILKMKIPKKKSKLSFCTSRIYNKIRQIAIVTLAANILLIPLSMYIFNSFSFTFLISNLLVQPLLSYIIIISIIQIVLSFLSIRLASIFSIFTNIIIELFLLIVKFCYRIPFSKVLVTTPSIITLMIIYCIIFVILVLDKKMLINKHNLYILTRKVKYIIKTPIIFTIIIILMVMSIYIKCDLKELKVFFIDVGQGDSSLIITPNNKNILIDGGGSEDSNFDIGEKNLVPYLLSRKVKVIDYMIVSHFDTDHVRRLAIFNEKYESKKCDNWKTV